MQNQKPTQLPVALKDGRTVQVPVAWKANSAGMTAYSAYGRVFATIGAKFPKERIPQSLSALLSKIRNIDRFSFVSMLDWPRQTIFVEGKRRLLTQDRAKANDPAYFPYPDKTAFTAFFDRVFASYLCRRLPAEAQRANLSLPADFKVKVGYFKAKLASYNVMTHEFKFDRRLYAYRPIVLDSVIDHELSHIISVRHDAAFYQALGRMMSLPVYRDCRRIITEGRFQDEPKGYRH